MGIQKYVSLTTRRRPDKGAIRRAHRIRRANVEDVKKPNQRKAPIQPPIDKMVKNAPKRKKQQGYPIPKSEE